VFATAPSAGQSRLESWPALLTILVASVLSQGTVDAFQNGINGIFSAYILKHRPVWISRLLVIVINTPAIIIATQVLNLCTACKCWMLFACEHWMTFFSAVISTDGNNSWSYDVPP
jgi:hypothetical protein